MSILKYWEYRMTWLKITQQQKRKKRRRTSISCQAACLSFLFCFASSTLTATWPVVCNTSQNGCWLFNFSVAFSSCYVTVAVVNWWAPLWPCLPIRTAHSSRDFWLVTAGKKMLHLMSLGPAWPIFHFLAPVYLTGWTTVLISHTNNSSHSSNCHNIHFYYLCSFIPQSPSCSQQSRHRSGNITSSCLDGKT